MSSKTDSQSLENFEFDDNETEFFGIKAGKTLTGAQELKSKGTKLKDDDTPFDFIEDDDSETTVLDEAEKQAKKDAASKKKASGAGMTRTKSSKEEEDEDDLDNDEDNQEDEDEDEDDEDAKSTKEVKKPIKKDDEEEDENEDKDDSKSKDIKGKKTDKEEETEEEKEIEFFTTLAEELRENKVFQSVKLKKGEKVTQEGFFDKFDEEIEARVADTVEAISEKMEDDGKRWLAYSMKGGKWANFMAVMGNRLNIDKLDPKDEEQADTIIKHHLTTVEKLTGEDLKDRLEYIKTKGDSETRAAKYLEAHKTNQAKAEAALLKQQEAIEKQTIEDNKQFDEDLQEVLDKVDKVGMIPITKRDKRELRAYITKPTIKSGKMYVPEINAEINRILTGEKPKDKKDLIALAKVLKEKFNIEDLVTEVQTRVTKVAKSKLMAAKNGSPSKLGTTGAYSKRALADTFSDDFD